jgi:hypothetical protein
MVEVEGNLEPTSNRKKWGKWPELYCFKEKEGAAR